MSKERELLERILVSGIFDSNLFEDWEQYIQELLAKPEQQVKSNRVFYQEGYAQAELDLKREPLNDLDVFTLYEEAEYIGFLAYRKGIKDAEKAHGITGVDDE